MVVTTLSEIDGHPFCQDIVLHMSMDELLRDVNKHLVNAPSYSLGRFFGPSEGYIKL